MPSLARRSGRYAPSPPPCAGPSAVAVVLRSDPRNPHALSPLAVRTSARRPVFAMTPAALSLGGKVARVHSRPSVRRHWQNSQSRLPTSDPPDPRRGCSAPSATNEAIPGSPVTAYAFLAWASALRRHHGKHSGTRSQPRAGAFTLGRHAVTVCLRGSDRASFASVPGRIARHLDPF